MKTKQSKQQNETKNKFKIKNKLKKKTRPNKPKTHKKDILAVKEKKRKKKLVSMALIHLGGILKAIGILLRLILDHLRNPWSQGFVISRESRNNDRTAGELGTTHV